jgi:hypothetical protein
MSDAGRRPALAALVLALAATFVVYRPITRNYFFADDFVLLYDLADRGPLTFILTPYGGHLYLVRNLVLYLTWLVAGTDPAPYYWTALLTHLVNVGLLFALVRVVTGRTALALVGSLLWGVCPLDEGSLGWYATYGQALAGTALLLLLLVCCRRARDGGRLGAGLVGLAYGLAFVASACFGGGLAVALVLPLVIALLFPGASRTHKALLASMVVVIPAIYAALHVLYGHISTRPVPGVPLRAALTQLPAVAVLFVELVVTGTSGLLLGSTAYGPTTHPRLAAALTLAVAAVIAIGARRARPLDRRILLGLGLVCLADYAAIAFARAPMRALFGAPSFAALAATARYHYVSPACVAAMLCCALAWSGLPLVRAGVLAGWLGAVAVSQVRGGWRIDDHGAARAETEKVLAAVRARVAAASPGEAVYVPNEMFHGVGGLFVQFPVLFPRWAGVFLVFVGDNVVDGRRVYFVETDPATRAALTGDRTRRIGRMIVSPADAPGH